MCPRSRCRGKKALPCIHILLADMCFTGHGQASPVALDFVCTNHLRPCATRLSPRQGPAELHQAAEPSDHQHIVSPEVPMPVMLLQPTCASIQGASALPRVVLHLRPSPVCPRAMDMAAVNKEGTKQARAACQGMLLRALGLPLIHLMFVHPESVSLLEREPDRMPSKRKRGHRQREASVAHEVWHVRASSCRLTSCPPKFEPG